MSKTLGLLLLSAAGMGMDINDLRVEYQPYAGREFESGGNVSELSLNYGGTSTEENADHDASMHQRVAVLYRRSLGPLRAGFGAPVWGLELADDLVRMNQGTLTYRGRAVLLDAYAGWGFKLTRHWHIEEGVLAGIGRTNWSQSFGGYYNDGSDWNSEDTAFTKEYGFDLATYYTFTDPAIQLGLDLRHVVTTSKAHFSGQHYAQGNSDPGDIVETNTDWKFTVEGIAIGLAAGYRF